MAEPPKIEMAISFDCWCTVTNGLVQCTNLLIAGQNVNRIAIFRRGP